ncbi:hypothetical protein LMG26411_06937 [Cupriavidus numazuensis]|uniref:Uncharacterized protein n=1 Tax=Cupriavidus numazuensis TaxID=221992 RepID=A0ABN7QEK2_9BURK|nr:hypothetical protein LMG26411_06937 [Cupriavidus numazuensis]
MACVGKQRHQVGIDPGLNFAATPLFAKRSWESRNCHGLEKQVSVSSSYSPSGEVKSLPTVASRQGGPRHGDCLCKSRGRCASVARSLFRRPFAAVAIRLRSRRVQGGAGPAPRTRPGTCEPDLPPGRKLSLRASGELLEQAVRCHRDAWGTDGRVSRCACGGLDIGVYGVSRRMCTVCRGRVRWFATALAHSVFSEMVAGIGSVTLASSSAAGVHSMHGIRLAW